VSPENLGLTSQEPAELSGFRFARSHDVTHTVLDGEAVLLDLDSGVYYTLNRVGTAIWELLGDDRPVETIVAAIREQFDVPEEVARRDLLALLRRLRDEGLVVVTEMEAHPQPKRSGAGEGIHEAAPR
jgi:hypothetical protein